MAIWQYDFTLIPKSGLVDEYGCVPNKIEDYFVSDDQSEEVESPNYWKGFDSDRLLKESFRELLGELESWSDNGIMFGTEDGNKAVIWKEGEVNCRFDLRSPNKEILDSILKLAGENNCKVLSHSSQKVLEPELALVTLDIKESEAYRFCMNPKEYLNSLGQSNPQSEQGAHLR